LCGRGYTIPLELILSKIAENLQRASRSAKDGACAKSPVSPKEKSEARNTNAKWTRFCEAILREEGFAKPRLMFLKFGGILPPRRRVREECGAAVLGLWRRGLKIKILF
jgi:hypothetical protein